MKVKDFSLVELLESRTWLTAVMNSTRAYVNIPLSKEQLAKIRLKLKEIDQELVDRIID